MSKLMLVFGILFFGLGVALGFLIEFQPGQMQVLALTPEVAALFLVGGALCWGLGDVASALREGPSRGKTVTPSIDEADLAGSTPATPTFKGFGNKTKAATAAVLAEASDAAAASAALSNTSVAETISALEQAKSDIAVALGVETHVSETRPSETRPSEIRVSEARLSETRAVEPEPKTIVAEAAPEIAPPETDDENDEADLYVVEEKVIRGRPARILSDGTVEAETDEGWMRFENLEHLDEYLGAMGTSDT
jgi:hypothetical protein